MRAGWSEHRSLRRTSRTLARVRFTLAALLAAALGTTLAFVLAMREERESKTAARPVLEGSSSAGPRATLEVAPAVVARPRVSGETVALVLDAGEESPGSTAEVATKSEAPEPVDAPLRHGLCGQVLLPDGSPAERANVCFFYSEKVTDSDGRFCFPFEGSDPGSVTIVSSTDSFFLDGGSLPVVAEIPIVANLRGYGPAIQPDAGALLQASFPNDPPMVSLVLSDEILTIGGSLEDQNGRALRGWTVEVSDPSVDEFRAWWSCGRGRFDIATTDQLGFFSTDELLPGTYSVRAHDPRTFASVQLDNVLAGTEDLELRARNDMLLPLLRGRIVTLNGEPLPGVQVTVLPRGGGIVSRSAATDSSGVFELRDVPREGVELSIPWNDFEQHSYEIEGLDPLAIEVVVTRLCTFELEATEGVWEGISFSILDEAGHELVVRVQSRGPGNMWIGQTRTPAIDSIGRRCRVGEKARFLCLFKEDEELLRRAIDLEPGALGKLLLELP